MNVAILANSFPLKVMAGAEGFLVAAPLTDVPLRG